VREELVNLAGKRVERITAHDVCTIADKTIFLLHASTLFFITAVSSVKVHPYELHLAVNVVACHPTGLNSYLKIAIACFTKLWYQPTRRLQVNVRTYPGGPQYPRVIRSKTYRGYVKPRIIPNAIPI